MVFVFILEFCHIISVRVSSCMAIATEQVLGKREREKEMKPNVYPILSYHSPLTSSSSSCFLFQLPRPN